LNLFAAVDNENRAYNSTTQFTISRWGTGGNEQYVLDIIAFEDNQASIDATFEWLNSFNASHGNPSSQDQLIELFNQYVTQNPPPGGEFFLHDITRAQQPDGSTLPTS